MANDYFNHVTNVIPAGVRATAAQVNNIATEIATGLDKLPTEVEIKQNRTIYAPTDTGAADAYVVSLPYTPTLTDGLNLIWKAANANTGASTLNVNGLGAKNLLLASGAALVGGDILANQQIWVSYESVSDTFRILSQSSSAGGGGGAATTIALLNENVDTTTFVPFAPDSSGNQALRTNANLTFNSATGELQVGSLTSAGAISGTTISGSGAMTAASLDITPAVAALYMSDVNANDGNPSSRLIVDVTNGDHDWYLSRGLQWSGTQWQLAAAGNSPTGIFFNGDGTQNGIVVVAAGNHNSLTAGSNVGRPEDFPAAVELSGLTGIVRLSTNGATRVTVNDTETVIDDLRINTNGLLTTAASITANAGLRIPHGTAPTSPVDGDFWSTTTGFFARINGATQAIGDVFKVGTPVNNQLGVWTGDGTIEGDANLTWDGNTLTAVNASASAIVASFSNNQPSRTNPVVEIIQDNTTGALGIAALRVQQDAGVPGILIANNGGNYGLDIRPVGPSANAINIEGTTLTSGNYVRVSHNTSSGGIGLVLIENLNTGSSAPLLVLDNDGTGDTIDMRGAGRIKFPATASLSSDANTLDDYEEGNHTATLNVGTGSVTLNTSFDTLSYTKVGRKVTCTGRLQVSTVSTPSGVLRLVLPFAVADLADEGEFLNSPIYVTNAVGVAQGYTLMLNYTGGNVNANIEIVANGNDAGAEMQANTDLRFNFSYFSSQ